MNQKLLDGLDELFEGEQLNEVIHILAFALSDSVAFATDYVYHEHNADALKDMVESAYRHACHDNNLTTVN